jgi:FGGY-family pentulose kinase
MRAQEDHRVTTYTIGIDVGSGSARAGVFDLSGRMLGQGSCAIRIWRPQIDFVEQSSNDIWQACCRAVNQAMAQSGVSERKVKGIGFDATCSLVVLDKDAKPLTVSPSGRNMQNVIVWMDHRAVAQADRINKAGHRILDYVGGVISPEMETPKLLWIKENLPETWRRAGFFFDLPDFLVFQATGEEVRSLCSTVCKWTYLGHEGRWDDSFFRLIGLDDLVDDNYKRIGQQVLPIGEAVGNGLTEKAAAQLGLNPGTAVGVSIIDAHAGGIGMLGASLNGNRPSEADFQRRLALIGGTSSCHMAVSQEPRFVPGVWGPYFSAMIPGLWLSEGGQSATGALVDHVIYSHTSAAGLSRKARKANRSIYDALNECLESQALSADFPAKLTQALHVLPYFHGNRSPRADPTLRGMVSGYRLSDSVEELARLYLAAIQAIAYGTRHIIEVMNTKGYSIDTIFACGGGTKNRVFLREHADATGCRIILPEEPEAVLLGSAILGAVASGHYNSVIEAMAGMTRAGKTIHPAGGGLAGYHAAKYNVFRRMYDDQIAYRDMMEKSE